MDNGLIADVVTLVVILVSYFTDTKLRSIKQKKEITIREKVTSDRLIALESGQVDIKMILKDMQGDDNFINGLINAIRMTSDTFVNINRSLSKNYKTILSDYAKITEDLSLRWYNSEFRGIENREKMQKYLKNDLSSRLKNTDNLMDTLIKKVKKLTSKDKNGKLFSGFVKENMLYNEFELLIMKLSQNGFRHEDEIKNAFIDFVNILFSKFADLVQVWSLLEEKQFQDGI